MRRALVRPLVMPLMGTAVGAVLLMSSGMPRVTFVEAAPPPANPLVMAHGCWTGPAPIDMAGRLPGHAVVSVNGRATYGGPATVHRAMEHIFNGGYPRLTVLGFCR
jgi:hypothetical protein